MVSLGDLVTLQRGITYKGVLVGEPGPALLGLGSIVPGGGFRPDFKTYGGDCPPDIMLHPGDLYVSLKGATKDGEMIGSVARVPDEVAAGRLTQDTVGLSFRDSASSLKTYVYWMLRNPHYREYCAARATGSAVVALSRDDFLAYPVPEFTAHRSNMVHSLELIEEKLASNRRARALSLSLAIAWLTSGVERVRVGDVAELSKGLSYKGSGLDNGSDPSAVPMFSLASFTTTGAIKESSFKYYSGEYKAKHLLDPWDLLIANTDLTQDRELLGRGLIVPTGLGTVIHTHHTSVLRFVGRPELALFLWAQTQGQEFRDRAKGFATGTTVTALPAEAVLDFEIQVPAAVDATASAGRLLLERSWQLGTEIAKLLELQSVLLKELYLARSYSAAEVAA